MFTERAETPPKRSILENCSRTAKSSDLIINRNRRGRLATSFRRFLQSREMVAKNLSLSPIKWNVKTHILYGEKDNLTPQSVITGFAEKIGASLEIMPGGEHWFHTGEQMKFLDDWLSGKK